MENLLFPVSSRYLACINVSYSFIANFADPLGLVGQQHWKLASLGSVAPFNKIVGAMSPFQLHFSFLFSDLIRSPMCCDAGLPSFSFGKDWVVRK
jgi:hypothetical protein